MRQLGYENLSGKYSDYFTGVYVLDGGPKISVGYSTCHELNEKIIATLRIDVNTLLTS